VQAKVAEIASEASTRGIFTAKSPVRKSWLLCEADTNRMAAALCDEILKP
jgi:hypothetical protein